METIILCLALTIAGILVGIGIGFHTGAKIGISSTTTHLKNALQKKGYTDAEIADLFVAMQKEIR